MPVVSCNLKHCKFNDCGFCQNEEDQITLHQGQHLSDYESIDCGFKPAPGWHKQSDGSYIRWRVH